ncbi:MAG: class I SAM-dependent methyltransferase [Terriglobales bacterium]
MALPAQSLSHKNLSDDSIGLLDALTSQIHPDFQVRLWDGSTWGAKQNPRFTLVLNDPGALRAIFEAPSEASLGEAYVYDEFDIEGDIEAAMTLSDALTQSGFTMADKLQLAAFVRKLPAPRHAVRPARLFGSKHSLHRDRQAIAYHYNLPTEFYSLFLDQRLVYSCAYFQSPDDDLETAQVQKLDYLCRKLRLRKGDRLLDIGCGWGALILHAAKHYGVDAFGITLSAPQAEVARQRIADAGLADRCRLEVCDYRELDQPAGFNKMVSVGMFEHVGEKMLPEYFSRAFRLLEPGGVFLNHGIAQNAKFVRKGESFTGRYVFPDGELVPLNVMARAAEAAGFEVRDVESLREHYAFTVREWLCRLEAHHDQAINITSEVTYRIWRLYLAGSAHGFSTGRLNLYQVLMCKPEDGMAHLPLTRDDWYRS